MRPDVHLRPHAWVRWWFRIDVVLTVLWLALVLEQSSNPGYNDVGYLLILASGFYLASAWLARAIGLLAWLVGARPARARTLRACIGAAIIPLAGFVGMVMVMTDAGTHQRFAWSESALRAEAESMRAGNAFAGPGWYGLHYVSSATLEDGRVYLVTRRGAWWDEYGYVHSPAGAPANYTGDPGEERSPVAPNWERFERSNSF